MAKPWIPQTTAADDAGAAAAPMLDVNDSSLLLPFVPYRLPRVRHGEQMFELRILLFDIGNAPSHR